jgi:Haspin like kinase domain
VQNEAYRAMRRAAQDAWRRPPCAASELRAWNNFTPATNCMWLAYLCDVLMMRAPYKELAMTPAQRKALSKFRCAQSAITCTDQMFAMMRRCTFLSCHLLLHHWHDAALRRSDERVACRRACVDGRSAPAGCRGLLHHPFFDDVLRAQDC